MISHRNNSANAKGSANSAMARRCRPRTFPWLELFKVLAATLGAVVCLPAQKSKAAEAYEPRPRGQLTFNKHIAPIIFRNCAICHRPGQSAPFALLSYAEVKKHSADVATATAKRYMPPWLPEPGYGRFVGERRLSVDELGMIQQWVAEGAVEGAPSDLPPAPQWNGDWQLGKPDLVVTMPQPYTLAAEGRDVYRNFVIPTTVGSTRYVKGVEFRPGNSKVVHHVFIRVDPTAQSRRLDAQDVEPGFGGMASPAKMPDGHFLGWQPGRLAAFVPDGLPWRLNPGDDLVFEMHMNPSGKPEQIQPSIGLYFTDRPATNSCFKLALLALAFELPAGAQDCVVEASYRLPVDAEVLAVLPHAHYLAKKMQGWATLPDGTRQWLLFIKQWDFNWQGDYRYAQPVSLPKGSTLSMRYTYDNSTNNVRNPNHPPKPVTYGPQSSDEMAELWFQLLPRKATELARLEADYQKQLARVYRDHNKFRLGRNPNDVQAHVDEGFALLAEDRLDEAEQQFRAAILIQPNLARAHYFLGLVLRQRDRPAEARAAFETVLRLDPNDSKAHGNLGFIFLELGNLASAQSHFETALRLNPADALARGGLVEVNQARAKKPAARP